MTKPTYEKMLEGNTRWVVPYKDVSIELSFHGYRPPEQRHGTDFGHGIWCYYLLLNELMFKEEDWKKLKFEPYVTDEMRFETYDYYAFPDVDFHGGITFYEVTRHYDRHAKRHVDVVKAGCDYNHLWDNEGGYRDNFDSVLMDAKHSVDELLRQFPDHNIRCSYSGIWDDPRRFYTASNGRIIHNSKLEEIKKLDYMRAWLPE